MSDREDREKKAERIFLEVVFVGAATAAVLIFSGTMIVLVWLLIWWLAPSGMVFD